MKKLNENLSDLLDIPEIETIEEKQNEIVPVETGEEISNDAQFARQNIKGLITKGDDALDSFSFFIVMYLDIQLYWLQNQTHHLGQH